MQIFMLSKHFRYFSLKLHYDTHDRTLGFILLFMGPILDTLSKQQLRPKMSEVRQIKEIFLKLNIYPLYESGLISLRVGHFVKF